MRWREIALALGCALVGSRASAGGEARPAAADAPARAAADDVREAAVDRLATAERTIDLLAERERVYRARLNARVRAFYKRERPGPARLWLEPDRRAAWLARRAAVARMLERDLRELDILAAERDSAVAARDRARAEVREASGHPELPAPGSLVAPVAGGRVVAGFGPARDRATGAHLVRRGIRLAARRGEPVLAVARGRVEWTGDLAGAPAVVIDHAPAPFRSVLSDLADVRVAPGQAVAAGQELARAAGGEVYLEIRLDRGAAGEPIDPAPLLGTRPAGAR